MNVQVQIESRKVEELVEDPNNARKHSPANIGAICASLSRFGQQKPIVVNASNEVLAGNGTLRAAKTLGWDEVAVTVTSLTGEEAMAYAISDNRTAELAEWNDDKLAMQLGMLNADETWDGAIAGFSEEEVNSILSAQSNNEIASHFDNIARENEEVVVHERVTEVMPNGERIVSILMTGPQTKVDKCAKYVSDYRKQHITKKEIKPQEYSTLDALHDILFGGTE